LLIKCITLIWKFFITGEFEVKEIGGKIVGMIVKITSKIKIESHSLGLITVP